MGNLNETRFGKPLGLFRLGSQEGSLGPLRGSNAFDLSMENIDTPNVMRIQTMARTVTVSVGDISETNLDSCVSLWCRS